MLDTCTTMESPLEWLWRAAARPAAVGVAKHLAGSAILFVWLMLGAGVIGFGMVGVYEFTEGHVLAGFKFVGLAVVSAVAFVWYMLATERLEKRLGLAAEAEDPTHTKPRWRFTAIAKSPEPEGPGLTSATYDDLPVPNERGKWAGLRRRPLGHRMHAPVRYR